MDDIDLALALAVGYLEAPDALTACFVCHGWRDALSTDGDNDNGKLAWKRVCLNIDALKTALFLANASAPIDYKRLAIRLTIDRSVRTDIRIPTTGTVPPTPLLLHDLFLVAEVYSVETVNGVQRKVPISAWTAPMTYPPKTEISISDEKEEQCILKGKNPFAEPTGDHESRRNETAAAWNVDSPPCFKTRYLFAPNGDRAAGLAHLELTLVRRSTLESLCLIDELLLNVHDSEWIFNFMNKLELSQSQGNYELSLKKNGFGREDVWLDDGHDAQVQLKATFAVVLPSPWSIQEPFWLRKCRRGEPFTPTRSDLDELEQTRFFDFRLKTITLDFKTSLYEGDKEDFESANELVVVLGGLPWK